jgi:hypothetical protein
MTPYDADHGNWYPLMWGGGAADAPREGETQSAFSTRIAQLRLRTDGSPDLRYRSSRSAQAKR